MDTAELQEAVRLAEDTERQAAADYRGEIAGRETEGLPELTPAGTAWVIAYDELKAARDALEWDSGSSDR